MVPEVSHASAVDDQLSDRRRTRDIRSFPPPDETDEIDINLYLKRLARRWPILCGGAALGVLLAVLSVSRTPRLYEASATLALTAQGEGILSASGEARALLTGRPAEEAIRELALDRPPYGLTAKTFHDRVTIENLQGHRTLRLTVRLEDPTAAARAASALANKLIDRMQALAREDWAAMREYTGKQVEQLRVRLDTAEKRLFDFRRGVPALRAERGEESRSRPSANSRFDRPEGGLRDSQSRVAALEQARQHPAGTGGSNANDQPLTRLEGLEAEYARLEIERDVARKVYIDVAARHEEVLAQMTASPPPMRITDGAVPLTEPISRGTSRKLALGFVTGLAFAAALVLVREARRPHEPDGRR